MPRRSPFTHLCRQAFALADPDKADLHVHSTASDGAHTPSQVVAFAAQAKLKAVALTDHDSIAGWSEARTAIDDNGFAIVFIPGVEISTIHESRDCHLLAYDAAPTTELTAFLAAIQAARRARFLQFIDRLRGEGIALSDSAIERLLVSGTSLGRRHVATLLVEAGVVRRRFEAFRRHLHRVGPSVPRLAAALIGDAIAVVRAAGGWTCLAHPPEDMTFEALAGLKEIGVDAVEVEFPAATRARSNRLREWAGALGMGCGGGSDCHGDERRLGARSIPMRDVHDLRRFARR
ncbi:MAG: PHP domain-containing protein [Gemmataceae bacterium]|nr:PHP domain-containing protein [Gemmataceae bacterium]